MCFSDSQCEHLSDNNPDTCHHLASPAGVTQSVTAEVIHDRLSGPVREEEQGSPAAYAEAPSRATSPRKAHRKTNRRKHSSDGSPPPMAPDPDLGPVAELRPDVRPWVSWQERREDQEDQGRLLDQTIEQVFFCFIPSVSGRFTHVNMSPQVIQDCCHGVASTSCHQERFFFSLPVSMETHSDDRDSVVQVSQRKALWEARVHCLVRHDLCLSRWLSRHLSR